ncbi:MAG TPA: ABC transporter permease [Vicinamibacterales bacterium]|nr:ABC transporter permease [Vicinamibacterales bacterium]
MLRRAWLQLWATPVFTLFAITSLALGVGVTTAIYSVILSLTRTAIDVPNAGQIGLVVGSDVPGGRRPTWRSVMSMGDFRDLAQALPDRLPAASAVFYQSAVTPEMAELVTGEAVTGNYFSMLGLAPGQGRLIQPSDDQASTPVVVISDQLWRTRLAADPDVIGKTIRIGGAPFEIVGVAPEGFDGLSTRYQLPTGLWVPLLAMPGRSPTATTESADRRRGQLSVLVPLAGASSVRSISAEVGAVGVRLDAAYPMETRAESGLATKQPRAWSVGPMTAVNRQLDSQLSGIEVSIMAIVGLVLVVACTNLANLVLARGSSRRQELAVRHALGASRPRLVMEQLAETSLLASIGAVGAFAVTRVLLLWATSLNIPVAASTVVQIAPRLDATTLIWAATSLLASLLVFGVGPAIQLTRGQLRPALDSDTGAGEVRWRTKRTLIAVQVMISLSFFLIAAFAVRAVRDEEARPSGVDVERLAMGLMNFGLPPWNEARGRETVDRLMDLVPGQPALDSAAVTSGLPFGTTYTPGADVTTTDKPFVAGRTEYPYAPLIAGTPSLFRTLGIPIVRGRGFEIHDQLDDPHVAVISEHTARELFGTVDVLGREILVREFARAQPAPESLTIVGIAADTDSQHRGSRRSGAVYVPLAQHFEPLLAFVGRTDRDPEDLVGPMKALALRADPDLVLDHPGSAAPIVMGGSILLGMVSWLAAALALLAMLLSMTGLFGVLSHLVSRRTREMGVRMALGAAPASIRALVIRDGFQPVASGLIMGYLIAIAVRLILPFADRFSAGDLLVFVLAPMPIVIAAVVACSWPAIKASRVDPIVALKEL